MGKIADMYTKPTKAALHGLVQLSLLSLSRSPEKEGKSKAKKKFQRVSRNHDCRPLDNPELPCQVRLKIERRQNIDSGGKQAQPAMLC